MSTIELLRALISTPSFSGEEGKTADIIENHLASHHIKCRRINNNIIARSKNFDPNIPSILLNSHHDTVKINDGWNYDPFGAEIDGDKLYGRGSNDAGGALVCLIHTFITFYKEDLPFNLVLAATGEEENFGPRGLSSLLHGDELPDLQFGIIGEPTSLALGAAQKGLIVVDGVIKGRAGHAARNTGINAIYECLKDIQTAKTHTFSRVSPYLGPTTMQLTMINAGSTHNVIPDHCEYVLDVRVNDRYTLTEVMEELDSIMHAQLKPRSLRWHSRGLPDDHPIIPIAKNIGIEAFGSPTLSDQVHCDFPTVKIGPGDSNRSHTANEYIKTTEIEDGIETYKTLIEGMARNNTFINYCKKIKDEIVE